MSLPINRTARFKLPNAAFHFVDLNTPGRDAAFTELKQWIAGALDVNHRPSSSDIAFLYQSRFQRDMMRVLLGQACDLLVEEQNRYTYPVSLARHRRVDVGYIIRPLASRFTAWSRPEIARLPSDVLSDRLAEVLREIHDLRQDCAAILKEVEKSRLRVGSCRW